MSHFPDSLLLLPCSSYRKSCPFSNPHLTSSVLWLVFLLHLEPQLLPPFLFPLFTLSYNSFCKRKYLPCKHASKTPFESILSMNFASYWCEEERKQLLVTGNKSTMKIILLIQPNNTLLSAYLTFFTVLNLMWQVTQVLKSVRLHIGSLIKENYGFHAVGTTIWEDKPIKKGPKKWGPNTESKICFILHRCW